MKTTRWVTSWSERVITWEGEISVEIDWNLPSYLLLLHLRHGASLHVRVRSCRGGGGEIPADQAQLAGVGQDERQADQEVHHGADQQTVAITGS